MSATRIDRLAEQARVRSARVYPDLCRIVQRVSNKVGLDTRFSTSILAQNIPCLITVSSATEREIAGATVGMTSYTVHMPVRDEDGTIELTSTCYIEVSARGAVAARTFQVIAPLPSDTTLEAVAVRQS